MRTSGPKGVLGREKPAPLLAVQTCQPFLVRLPARLVLELRAPCLSRKTSQAGAEASAGRGPGPHVDLPQALGFPSQASKCKAGPANAASLHTCVGVWGLQQVPMTPLPLAEPVL